MLGFAYKPNIILRVFLLGASLFLFSCGRWEKEYPSYLPGDLRTLKNFPNDFGPRIKIFLDLAEEELIENYKKKKFLMIREDQPRAVLHPRKDLTLRNIIETAYAEEKISTKQFNDFSKRCDDLYSIWEKHWRSADKKARQLGFDR